MRTDRHANDLFRGLLRGEALTADQRRHVAACVECQRAAAAAGSLDEQLRTAAGVLAREPMPDNLLDLAPDAAPRVGWLSGAMAAAAALLLAVTLGLGASQLLLRPEVGESPLPSAIVVVPDDSGGPAAPTPTSAPTPTPVPSPPATAPLVEGPDQCADGAGGFGFPVPDGWYANRRVDNVPACAYLAPQAFAVPGAGGVTTDLPIWIRVDSDGGLPMGQILERRDVTVGQPAVPGVRMILEADSGRRLVYQVGIADGAPDGQRILTAQTDADDAEAVATLELVVGRLSFWRPMTPDPVAAAEAATLFEDIDGCINVDDGFVLVLPDAWWTNTRLDELAPCTYLAPAFFEVPDPGVEPEGIAIRIELIQGPLATVTEVHGMETLVVDGHSATRWEIGAFDDSTATVYQYEVQLGDTPESGPNLVATSAGPTTPGAALDAAVLDEVMRTIQIRIPPDEVRDREQLPTCGWELVERRAEGEVYDVDSRACLWDAYEAGEPAEWSSAFLTVEGAWILEVYRVLAPGRVELVVDATRDHGGSMTWQFVSCTSLERFTDDASGAILFGPGTCGDPVMLDRPATGD